MNAQKFTKKSIDSINKFAIESEFHFDDIEEDVHEKCASSFFMEFLWNNFHFLLWKKRLV